MEVWTIIAICLVVPAALFLVAAGVISSLRMSRREIQAFMLTGMVSLLLAVVCSWLLGQEWLVWPWQSFLSFVGGAAGLVVAYALIVVMTVCVRRCVT